MLAEKMIQEMKKNEMSSAFVMLYFYDQVVIGKYDQGQLYFAAETPSLHKTEYCYEDELCFEIHIFNKEKEIRWTRESDVFYVINNPEEGEYFSEEMFMPGNKNSMQYENGCTRLEQYGRVICVPWKTEIKNNPLRLVVQHLFDPEKAVIRGYRLVEIKGGIV